MSIKLLYDNKLAKSVSLIYIENYKMNSDELHINNLPMIKKNEYWEVDVNFTPGTFYKLQIDGIYDLLDPRATEFKELSEIGYWSILPHKFNLNPTYPNVEKLCICKNLNENLDPIGIINSVTPLEQNILFWAYLSGFKKDTLVSTVWRSNKKVYYAGDLLVKNSGIELRKVYIGIDIRGGLLTTNIFEQGKCFVDLYLNGYYKDTIIFNINKLQTYTSI